MPTDTTETPRVAPRRAKKIALSAVVVLAALATLSLSSLALFTDTETVTGNGFTTGTIDIAAAPATAVVTMPVAAPGDQVTAPLTNQRRITRSPVLHDRDHHRGRTRR